MKTKNLFLTVVLLFIATLNYAQTSAEASGIAIQGIARDAGNTARIDAAITLTFELYYINASSAEVPVGAAVDANLTTDNFGVFSYVLEPGVANNATMANHQAYLKISEGSTTISDEKLNHVPYAIAANNGVPTGSIMPWVGPANAVPTGWVLCNNQSLTGIVGSDNLIALVGNNAPDLRGMFLRGAGTNAVSGYTTNSGPDVNMRQQDDNLSHNHGAGNITANNAGVHSHSTTIWIDKATTYVAPTNNTDGGTEYYTPTSLGNDGFDNKTSSNTGTHDHTTTGNTTSVGTESRPVNYGVHYIIKL
jgi:hypothetical protein